MIHSQNLTDSPPIYGAFNNRILYHSCQNKPKTFVQIDFLNARKPAVISIAGFLFELI